MSILTVVFGYCDPTHNLAALSDPVCLPFYEFDMGFTNWAGESKSGSNRSTTPCFEMGLHLSYSRWFYRTRPYENCHRLL